MLRSDAAVGGTAALLRVLGVAVDRAPEIVLARVEGLAWSGWPGRPQNSVNLDLSRFVWRVRQRLRGRPSGSVGPRSGRPLRVGWVGPFSGTLFPLEPVLRATPPEVESHVFDIEFRERGANYLRESATRYVRTPTLGGEDQVAVSQTLAKRIGESVDILVAVLANHHAWALLDAIDVPVVDVCTNSDILHHGAVSFALFPQPSADYFAVDDHLFCGRSRARFGPETVYPAWVLYDLRGHLPATGLRWAERDPLVLFHGSLAKAAHPEYLDVLFGLLREDPALELVLMGRDRFGALERIRTHARRSGVEARVRYEGWFDSQRRADGTLEDVGWDRLRDVLGRARLAPNPWPFGGGNARVEAYAHGVPAAHLRLQLGAEWWGKPQPTTLDLPALEVQEGTADTVSEYAAVCRRCLHDGSFADALAATQVEVAARVTSGERYWAQLLERYEQWSRGEGG